MEETVIIIMLKNPETGFLDKELGALNITKNDEYIVNIYVMEGKLYIRLSTGRDVEDWEYSAIYDYYDTQCFGDLANVIDIDDDYNPTWEIVADYNEDLAETQDFVNKILEIHTKELADVFETIADKEKEYNGEQ